MVEQDLFLPPGEGLYIPEHVQCLLHEGGAVVADYEQGWLGPLYEFESGVLQVINEKGSLAALAEHFEVKTHMSPDDAIRAAADWVNTLMAPGCVVQGEGNRPPPRKFLTVDPLPERPFPQVDATRYTWREIENISLHPEEHQAANEGVSYAVKLINDDSLTFGAQIRRLSELQSPGYPPATEAELLRTLASIHYVSKDNMNRVACLEVTVAAFIANARLGRKAGLSFGACVDPVAFHAWLTTVDGRPVRLPSDEVVEGVYSTLKHIE